MTYRTLLVVLDHDRHCAVRRQLAVRLARDLDCHVTGLAVTGVLDVPPTPIADASLLELSAHAARKLRQHAGELAVEFRRECEASGLHSFEAVVEEAGKAQSVVRHAHCSDLVLLGQADPEAADFRQARKLVEQVLLYGGRPALVLPYVLTTGPIGTNVLVAWDDSRESARAIADALPLLRRAEHVQVVSWRGARDDRDEALPSRLEALRTWLQRHGVTAEARIDATELRTGEALLSRAADQAADLIVMGAYGQSRWTEQLLGGTTRTLLATMTVPVLMSH